MRMEEGFFICGIPAPIPNNLAPYFTVQHNRFTATWPIFYQFLPIYYHLAFLQRF